MGFRQYAKFTKDNERVLGMVHSLGGGYDAVEAKNAIVPIGNFIAECDSDSRIMEMVDILKEKSYYEWFMSELKIRHLEAYKRVLRTVKKEEGE